MYKRIRSLSGYIWRTIEWRLTDRGRHYAARLNRRRASDVTFIGITGSAGKTTTKDLIAGMLASEGNVRSVPGSPNDNEMVDRLVLATRRSDRFSVVEVGAPGPSVIDRSIRALKPTIGVLTVVAQEHYSAFRSLEMVAAEKRKLIDAIPADGIAVVNIDDPRVDEIAKQARARVITVGRSGHATIKLLDVFSAWPESLTLRVSFEGVEYVVRTLLHGRHLAVPVLCALGVGVAVGMPFARAIEQVSHVEPAEGRMQIVDGGGGVIFIRDDFKAPEWSLSAPLEYLREATAERKIAVIGTISDSSVDDKRRYARAVRQAIEVADLVILVGSHTMSQSRARALFDVGRVKVFRNLRNASDFLNRELRSGDLVLLKGTNKQDHLLRIILNRTAPVKCWEMDCGRQAFCGTACTRVHIGSPFGASNAGWEMPWLDDERNAAKPIVISVGNPEATYAGTPHNVAHDLVDQIAAEQAASWVRWPEGLLAEVMLGPNEVWLFKPKSHVNLTGSEVANFLRRTSGSPNDCVVLIDDVLLDMGASKIKRDGGDGGHKGMRSIISSLGTDEIVRLKIGVRRGGDVEQNRSRVLEKFGPNELRALAPGLARARNQLVEIVAQIAAVQNRQHDEAALA